MDRASIPPDAKVFVELGTRRPSVAGFEPFVPFKWLWVITDGLATFKFLWIAMRRTGLYVASAGPGERHTSYHADGRFHWKSGGHVTEFERRVPLAEIQQPISVQNAGMSISRETLESFKLPSFAGAVADQVIYLDSRVLPPWLNYQVWAVPPFRHGDVPLMTDYPAHLHVATHTNPWIVVVIYEQGTRTGAKVG